MQHAAGFCEAELHWLIDTIAVAGGPRVADAPTRRPSTRAAANSRSACGASARRVQMLPRDGAGDHLLAEFGCGTRQVLRARALRHRVAGRRTPAPALARGRTAGSTVPGVYDMKAGLAVAMLAVRALQASPGGLPGRVTCLLTSDEETGSESSRDGHRRRGAAERCRAGARAVTARRRGEDLRARAAGSTSCGRVASRPTPAWNPRRAPARSTNSPVSVGAMSRLAGSRARRDASTSAPSAGAHGRTSSRRRAEAHVDVRVASRSRRAYGSTPDAGAAQPSIRGSSLGDDRRYRPAAAWNDRPAVVRLYAAGAGPWRRHRARPWEGEHRRRVGRKLHGRDRRPNTGRPGCGRGRRPRRRRARGRRSRCRGGRRLVAGLMRRILEGYRLRRYEI